MAPEAKKVLSRIVPSVDSFYMGFVLMFAASCRDPEEQRAAVVIDAGHTPLGIGVNYLPHRDHMVPNWCRKDRKNFLVLAEEQALDKASRGRLGTYDLAACTLYLTGPPKMRGLRRIMQAGIKNVIFGPQTPADFDSDELKEIISIAKDQYITIKAFDGNVNWVRDRVMRMEDTLF